MQSSTKSSKKTNLVQECPASGCLLHILDPSFHRLVSQHNLGYLSPSSGVTLCCLLTAPVPSTVDSSHRYMICATHLAQCLSQKTHCHARIAHYSKSETMTSCHCGTAYSSVCSCMYSDYNDAIELSTSGHAFGCYNNCYSKVFQDLQILYCWPHGGNSLLMWNKSAIQQDSTSKETWKSAKSLRLAAC